jgi:hypothetical protein
MALTLLDIAKQNGSVGDLIEDSLVAAPEARIVPARTISGYMYKSLHRSTVPTVGFRDANEGAAAVQSVYLQRIHETFVVDASSEVDVAVAEAAEDGVDVVLAREAQGMLEGAFRGMGSQFFYGTATTVETSIAGSPTKGFQGLNQLVGSTIVVDKAGTGSARSSVWAVKFGENGVQWVVGNNGAIQTDAPRIVRVTDSNSNPYDAWRTPLRFNMGLQVANTNVLGRIKNITAAATLDDDDIFNLLSLFPVAVVPDALFMSRRSLEQLRASRTATNITGIPAPTPDSVAGIPIIVTDSILDTEDA